jgi:hypothetical protein
MLAILAKYTAVLFLPALVCLWFTEKDGALDFKRLRSWFHLIAYTVIATLPAVIWVVYSHSFMRTIPNTNSDVNGYFLRFDEWTALDFSAALMSLWPYLTTPVGAVIWYPGVLLVMIAIISEPLWTIKQCVLPLAIFLPWFLEIGFPRSWVANPYYVYPALYPLCVLFAVVGVTMFNRMGTLLNLPDRSLPRAASIVIVYVALSNIWDYRSTYHNSYHPWPIIEQPKPYYSAIYVANVNSGHKPVLTDLPLTLYYTEAEPEFGRYLWWGSSDRATIAAIETHDYEYIVFTYSPTVEIMNTIYSSGYRQIAPAAWQLSHP